MAHARAARAFANTSSIRMGITLPDWTSVRPRSAPQATGARLRAPVDHLGLREARVTMISPRADADAATLVLAPQPRARVCSVACEAYLKFNVAEGDADYAVIVDNLAHELLRQVVIFLGMSLIRDEAEGQILVQLETPASMRLTF
jgi:hypothetical protein